MTTLLCVSYFPFSVFSVLCFWCSLFALGHDYPLLYVLLSAFSVCCFLTLVFALCFRCLPFALDNDYSLLYVLFSFFGASPLLLVSAFYSRR